MSEAVSIPFAPEPANAQPAMVPMRDGVNLAADVYLPGVQRDLAAILVRLPYDKCGEYTMMPRIEAAFTTAGYAFIVQDVRGRTRSEGETFPFIHEVDDGYDTLEWVTAQPWSNGAVGMIGESYYGFTSWCAAASRHPALKAIAPRVTAANLGMSMEPSGDDAETLALSAIVPWLSYVWIDCGMYEAEFDWSIRPLRDAFAAATGGLRSAGYEAMLQRPFSDPWWMRTIYGARDPHRVVDIPVLHWAGWWDNCQYGQFRSYRRMRARPDVRDRQYLIADAVDHEAFTWDESPRTVLDPDDFGADAHSATEPEIQKVVEQYRMSLPFFDRFVRGVDDSPLPRVRWMLTGEGWRESEAWPPPKSHEVEFHLVRGAAALAGVEGGGLAPQAEAAARRVDWTHDPQDLVPDTHADEWHPLGLGLPDESAIEDRPDVLTFTGDVLDTPLCLAGPVSLSACFASSAESLHVFVKLCDVDPEGYARRLLIGAAAVHAPDYGRPVAVPLGDIGFLVPAGHRLRLEVAASCFPRFLWHPGTTESPWDAVEGAKHTQSIVVGGPVGAWLRLNAIE